MLPIAQKLYADVRELHERIYKDLQALQAIALAGDLEEMADSIYALKEAKKFAEDTEKDIGKLQKMLCDMFCLKYTQCDDGNAESIRTDYCTATPNPRVCAHIPSYEKQPEEYKALMTYLGVDPVLWDTGKVLTENGEESTKVVDVHWPGFTALLSRLAGSGHPLPPGIDPEKTYMLWNVTIRKKKGILGDVNPNTEETPF